VIAAMADVAPLAPVVSIDGGLSKNAGFRRFLARALGRTVSLPATAELTGLGAAKMALIGAGLAALDDPSLAAAPRLVVPPDQPLEPALLSRFEAAVERSRGWR
jgi:glycerol kinase